MDLVQQIAGELDLKTWQAENTVRLLKDGNSIPFIARYRKEKTGELDELKIAAVKERAEYLESLQARKEEILRLLEGRDQLTGELALKIKAAGEKQALEDLYRPFRPKRQTRAAIAREQGLEPLARAMADGDPGFKEVVLTLVNPESAPESTEAALNGAMDILAEQLADDPDNRQATREITWNRGLLICKAKDPEASSVYQQYYDYSEALKRLPTHRVLAINRGEREEYLKVKIQAPEEEVLAYLRRGFIKTGPAEEYLEAVVKDAYHRLLAPAVERELRGRLTEQAEEKALEVFSDNLHHLLLQAPVRNKTVLAIDPAYRTGCKAAVVDGTGKFLATGVIYPVEPYNRTEEAAAELTAWVEQYAVEIIVIGNGTASRETELFVAGLLPRLPRKVVYSIVNEAGASVYSASAAAREEFAELEASQRSAVSLARRLQDPLAELVKIDPAALGVGQYQHDVNQKRLGENLNFVVETVVNRVGVEVNTASAALLSRVSGLNHGLAKNIVALREKRGKFRNRKELTEVPRLGPRTFEQCAGFLRLAEGDEPLDNTPIHPESYPAARQLLASLGFTPAQLKEPALRERLKELDLPGTATKLGIGLPTLKDMVEALLRPGRDPRDTAPPPVFRRDVLKMEDLKPGMRLTGTVRNVVDFGAFVDIGVKQDGLVHISELSEGFVRHPSEVVAVGDTVLVTVLGVDIARGRISLSLKQTNEG